MDEDDHEDGSSSSDEEDELIVPEAYLEAEYDLSVGNNYIQSAKKSSP